MSEFLYNYLRVSAGNIYLWLPILGGMYGLAYLAKKYYSRAPDPLAVAGVGFFLLLLVFPSLPRYMFGDITRNQLSRNEPWFHFIESESYRSLIEPMTWISAPEDALFFVSPNVDVMVGGWRYNKSNSSNAFISMRVTYNSGKTFELIEMDCASSMVSVSFTDEAGVFRALPARSAEGSELVVFCERDYSDSAKMIYQHLEKDTNLKQPD